MISSITASFLRQKELSVVRKVIYKNGEFSFHDTLLMTKFVETSLLTDWGSFSFWYVSGYAPIKFDEPLRKNTFILMTIVPAGKEVTPKFYKYCLIPSPKRNGFHYAELYLSKDVNLSHNKILAVSIGPTYYNFNDEDIDYSDPYI